MTVHDNIDYFLAADLHGELTDEERHALQTHLMECGVCRRSHQENHVMNKVLEDALSNEKPDPQFEQRMLAGFRSRIPLRRGGLGNIIADIARLRSTWVAATAIVLVALVQFGQVMTRTSAIAPLLLAHRNDVVNDLAGSTSKSAEEVSSM